jgi:hypothetical protein
MKFNQNTIKYLTSENLTNLIIKIVKLFRNNLFKMSDNNKNQKNNKSLPVLSVKLKCVCVCIYIYIYIYVCVCLCVCVCVFMNMVHNKYTN